MGLIPVSCTLDPIVQATVAPAVSFGDVTIHLVVLLDTMIHENSFPIQNAAVYYCQQGILNDRISEVVSRMVDVR